MTLINLESKSLDYRRWLSQLAPGGTPVIQQWGFYVIAKSISTQCTFLLVFISRFKQSTINCTIRCSTYFRGIYCAPEPRFIDWLTWLNDWFRSFVRSFIHSWVHSFIDIQWPSDSQNPIDLSQVVQRQSTRKIFISIHPQFLSASKRNIRL